MTNFTNEELTLICLYDPGSRAGVIYELRDMLRYLMPDEQNLKELTESAIQKLEQMTDEEYEAMSETLISSGFDPFDEESEELDEMESLIEDGFGINETDLPEEDENDLDSE